MCEQIASCFLSLFTRENPENSLRQDSSIDIDNRTAVRVTAAAGPDWPSVADNWTQTVWTVENVVFNIPGDLTGVSDPESLGPPALDLTDPDTEVDRSGVLLEGWEMEQLPWPRLRTVTKPAPRMPGFEEILAGLDDTVTDAVIDMDNSDRPALEPLLLEEEVVDWAEQEGSAGASKVVASQANPDSAEG